ncbi:MAG: YqgE/AlgH family protein [Lentimicrobium sp.]|nr:YqgE/AlgH family protein [Lentimicrobium sp.]
MEPLKIKPLAGRILISVPFLQDFYFRKSVVLLADHNDDGSFGLIINKPVDVKLSDISEEFSGFDAPVYLGGPVKTDSLFFIHTRPDLIDEGSKILEGLYWGGNIDKVRELLRKGILGPGEIRFYVGYAGWTANQLDQELEENSWVVSLTDLNQVIRQDTKDLWNQTLKKLGREYKLWVNYPPDPLMN